MNPGLSDFKACVLSPGTNGADLSIYKWREVYISGEHMFPEVTGRSLDSSQSEEPSSLSSQWAVLLRKIFVLGC